MNDTSLNDQHRLANYCLPAPFIKPLSLSLSIPPSVSFSGTWTACGCERRSVTLRGIKRAIKHLWTTQ